MLVLGLTQNQARGAYLAAYWDGDYPDHWIGATDAAAVRDALEAAGYEILDAGQLKAWMDARIADGVTSVVVFSKDVGPDTVCETNTADCTLRKYLDAGGKIVFYGDIPFYNQGNPGGVETNWGTAGSTGILGFNAAGGAWDSSNTVTFTDEGIDWGLTETWASVRPASPDAVDIVLAEDDAGNAAAWVKHFMPGDTSGGFVRIWDRGNVYSADDLMRVILILAFRVRPMARFMRIPGSPCRGTREILLSRMRCIWVKILRMFKLVPAIRSRKARGGRLS
jgi:hypothetical protein